MSIDFRRKAESLPSSSTAEAQPLLHDESITPNATPRAGRPSSMTVRTAAAIRPPTSAIGWTIRMIMTPMQAWERLWNTPVGSLLASSAAIASLLYFMVHLFPMTYHPPSGASPPSRSAIDGWLFGALSALERPDALTIENRADMEFVNDMLQRTISPVTVCYLYSVTALGAIGYVLGAWKNVEEEHEREVPGSGVHSDGEAVHAREKRPLTRRRRAEGLFSCVWRTLISCLTLLYLGVTIMPLDSINPTSRRMVSMVPDAFGIRQNTMMLHNALEPFHASNSYGLFRRMTGVGAVTPAVQRDVPSRWGWGGLEPSVVRVPAVVLEGATSYDPNSGVAPEWIEIPFRYAPYKESRAPRRTAPHQPRLDWQMWFAALGSYHHNGWLLHLMYKILLGNVSSGGAAQALNSPVLQLLDLDTYAFHTSPPVLVRATLYHYDFTRLPSPWASRIPDAPILAGNCSARWTTLTGWSGKSHTADGRKAKTPSCRNWWRRTKVREYVPAVSRETLLSQVVSQQGWPTTTARPQGDANACAPNPKSRLPRFLCHAIVALRREGAPLRRFVGFEVRWWDLGSPWFLDGPLLVITSLLLIPLVAVGVKARLFG